MCGGMGEIVLIALISYIIFVSFFILVVLTAR